MRHDDGSFARPKHCLPAGLGIAQASVHRRIDRGGRIAASRRMHAGAAERRAPRHRSPGHAQPAQPRLPARHGRARRDARASADSFWSWREMMYRFALSMTPDQVEAVAAQLYVEMLEAGFGRVGEFHYLHHDRDGKPYANIAEMAERIAAAADATGISADAAAGLLRAFAASAAPSPDRGPAALRQRSRIASPGCSTKAGARSCALDGAVVGVAPHSLRAVTPDELRAVPRWPATARSTSTSPSRRKRSKTASPGRGARPVEWLLGQRRGRPALVPDPRHPHDRRRDRRLGQPAAPSPAFARSPKPISATALSRAGRFLDAGGRFGIGSDSNVLIGVADELRQLEYSQRLAHRDAQCARQGQRLDRARGCSTQRCAAARRRSAPGLPASRQAAPPTSFRSTLAHPTLAGKTRRRHPRRLDLRRRRHGRLRLGAREKARRGRPPSFARRRRKRPFAAVMTEL